MARKKAEPTLERRRLGATHDQSAAQNCENAMSVGCGCAVPMWQGALPTRAIAFGPLSGGDRIPDLD